MARVYKIPDYSCGVSEMAENDVEAASAEQPSETDEARDKERFMRQEQAGPRQFYPPAREHLWYSKMASQQGCYNFRGGVS